MTDEHLKELLLRVENNLKDEIGSLKHDVANFQQRAVTRVEHDQAIAHIHKELERIERRVDRTHDQWKEELAELKQDIKDSQHRLIAIAGVVFVAVQFMLTWLVN